jgi:hypothetical protein
MRLGVPNSSKRQDQAVVAPSRKVGNRTYNTDSIKPVHGRRQFPRPASIHGYSFTQSIVVNVENAHITVNMDSADSPQMTVGPLQTRKPREAVPCHVHADNYPNRLRFPEVRRWQMELQRQQSTNSDCHLPPLSARASQYSTNSSSRGSRTPSIFSESLAERSSTYSWMSSPSMSRVEPLQEPQLLEEEAGTRAVAGAENASTGDLKPKFPVSIKYWCTICNERCFARDIWQLHEARCYWRGAQYSCPYCDERFTSESRFRDHHRYKHATLPCVVRCADARSRRAGWGCGFCAAYLDRWEERCNHVGDHFETGSPGLVWQYSNVVRGLLRQPEIDRHWQDLLVEKHGPNPESHLTIQFSKPKIGRPDTNLQDMLEHETRCDLKGLAQIAYDLGVRPHLSDVVDVTASETECASKLSNLTLLEEGEKHPARYLT